MSLGNFKMSVLGALLRDTSELPLIGSISQKSQLRGTDYGSLRLQTFRNLILIWQK